MIKTQNKANYYTCNKSALPGVHIFAAFNNLI